jgi:hypothetical protein
MTLRVVRERSGAVWQVWEVHPSWPARQGSSDPDSPRPPLAPALAGGWLTFASDGGERRRIVPIPDGWHDLSDDALTQLLARATPVRRRHGRLIE